MKVHAQFLTTANIHYSRYTGADQLALRVIPVPGVEEANTVPQLHALVLAVLSRHGQPARLVR